MLYAKYHNRSLLTWVIRTTCRLALSHWLNCNRAVFPQPWRNVSARWRSCAYIKGYNRRLDANIKHYIPPEDWPPNSPDLSPIENVWSIMVTTVYADPEPQSLQALKHRLRKAWTSIYLSVSTLQNLIGSMPNRLKALKTMDIRFHTNILTVNMDSDIAWR